MRWLAAPLAAALAVLALGACGDGGAEPGASEEATLVLDFQPNAVHTGIYRALAQGYYSDRGVEPRRARALDVHRRAEAARVRPGRSSRSSTSTTSGSRASGGSTSSGSRRSSAGRSPP